MSIDLVGQVTNALNIIRSTVPDAIVQGQLVKYESSMNASTLKSTAAVVDSKDVECIFGDVESELLSANHSRQLTTEVHIIGFEHGSLDDYDALVIDGRELKTQDFEEIRIGLKVPLRTFVISR